MISRGTTPEVLALSEGQRIGTAASDKVWRVGERPVFDVRLASGRRIRATAKHRLLGATGWVRVGDLGPGTRLAIARRLPEPPNPGGWPDARVALLGHLVGDGSYLVHQPLRYTTASEENSQLVSEAARSEFGVVVNRHAGRGAWHQLVFSGNGNRWHPRDLIDRHHARAAADGTRIIPCCGFDSVPSDLGAWLVMRHLLERHGAGCVEVKAYYRMRGGFNGGTLASALNLQDSGQAARFRDPFLLSPGRHSRREIERNRDPEWISYDEAIGAWVGPYFMGPINTRVVRRSAALFKDWGEPYGEDFAYQEYLRYDRGPAGWLLAAAATGAAGLFQSVLASPARGLIRPLLPQPGSGPSYRSRERGWFECVLSGRGEDGSRARARIAFRGDPGNRASVAFLCESGLALADDGDRLPGGAGRGGVLTPATGLGGVLAEWLKRTGTTLEIGG